jgi:radical SAM superfamily enzyme YgiQ (UPF0313 family)
MAEKAEKADLVLIKVNNQKKLYQDLSKGLSGIEPPVWIALTAAFLREKNFSVAVVDAEAENLSIQETVEKASRYNPIVVGIVVSGTNPSASTTNMTGASALLNEFKQTAPEIVTTISGLHTSALPERTVKEENADFVFEGEGFYTFEDLLTALKSGKSKANDFSIKGLWYKRGDKIISNPRAENINDLNTLPIPAWDLLPMDKYRAHNWHCFDDIKKRKPYAVVYTSLGCPYKCSFCCINTIFGGRGIRYRSIDKVIEEIDYLAKTYGVRNIKILDEIFVLKQERLFEFCDRVKALGHDLNFWVYGRVDTVKENMLKSMKEAGINWIAYGFEAGSKKVRDSVSKGRFDQEQIRNIVHATHDAGINIVANFIFGLPEDDLETMQETLDLAKELNCAYANFYCAMAYPGSQLYDDAVSQGVSLPATWSGYAQFSEDSFPLPTKYLSGGQVLRFRDQAFDNYYNDTKYLSMMEKKFGAETVEHIKQMCSVKMRRKYYNCDNKIRLESTLK